MKALVFALLLTLSTSLRTEAQATPGSLIYNLVKSAGKLTPIHDATGSVQTGELFYAELWAAKAPADESSLSPVPGSFITWLFPDVASRGGGGVKILEIPGTEGAIAPRFSSEFGKPLLRTGRAP